MTREQKDLILKDLYTRLPYGVKCEVIRWRIDGEMVYIRNGSDAVELTINNVKELVTDNLYDIKPYLFPLSSMTDEQKNEFDKMVDLDVEIAISHIKNDIPLYTSGINKFNWLIKNHFDIYGLIPMGLAIDATGLDIY